MSAQDFDVPMFGDDGLAPDRRDWMSMPLTVMFWSLVFTIVYFSTRNIAIEDSVAASGYIGILLIAFIVIIFLVIPATTVLLGRLVDDSTAGLSAFNAGMRFAALGLGLSLIPAVFIYALNHTYGSLPFTQFLIPSALAPLFTRLSLDASLRSPVLRTAVISFTVLVVVGSLAIGVSVFTGHI